ncbi:MAG: ABC transporter ATP-binding protein [Gammaproteobacteria bacterium]
MTSAVEFQNVSRYFGTVKAVDDVSFQIEEGEFFAMLGPSGSGKTTCLRLIAGFEQPSTGQILIHGEPAQGKPPYERDVNTVFQDYALFPHMNVAENVAYGPMVRGVDKASRSRDAERMLALVKLEGMGKRKPGQLSGGQRQRVALARALINKPRVLLLDEPLGALDLKLREQMQIELKALQRSLGITFVFVTHDQGEALSMSDRLAVFNHGRIEQLGAPEVVYENPATPFVAGFVGISNVLDAQAARRLLGDGAQAIAIRPEKILLASPDHAPDGSRQGMLGTVKDAYYHGASTRYQVALDGGGELTVVRPNTGDGARTRIGERVRLSWRREDVHILTEPGA